MRSLALCLLVLLLLTGPASAQYQGFLIPNAPNAAYPAQSQVFSQDFQAITEGIRSNGVVSGVLVTQKTSPSMVVNVASGSIQFQGAVISVSSLDLTVPQADSLNPRIDIVSISGAGVPTYTVGVVAQPPLSLVPPTIPQTSGINNIVVAFVYVPANVTSVFQNQIIDKRVFPGAGGGGTSPVGPFVLATPFPSLTQARVLTSGTGISIGDGGPGSSLTVSNTGVTSAVAGNCISVSTATGAVTISDICVSPGGTITGSGTLNTVSKFTAPQSIGNSTITDNGTTIALGATNVQITNQVAGSGHACLQVDTTGIVTSTNLPCSSGFSGTVNIAGSNTTGTVVFGSAQPDTSYTVTLGTRAHAGSPPAVLADYKSKATTGFTVEITAPPGSGNSVDVDWQVGSGAFGTAIGGSGTLGQIGVWASSSSLTGFPDLTFASHIMTVASGTSLIFNGGSGGAIGFTGPPTVATPVTWKLPTGDGSAGTCLSTNGSAVLGWANCSSGGTGLTSLNGQTGATQTFAAVANNGVTFTIGSASNVHTFTAGLGTTDRTRMCVVTTGDPGAGSPALADDNDAPVACNNDYGADWTITAVACWANAGSPTVTPILTGGSGTSLLTGPLTCGTGAWAAGTVNGTPVVHSFSSGATCSSTPCSMDMNITTAGGVAKYIVFKISGTLP